jgi:hypothetical protein
MSKTRIGIYASKKDEYGNMVECCIKGEQPDLILIGTFDTNSEFVGRVITNWCDKYPTDSLQFRGNAFYDQGGIAEDENGVNNWLIVEKEFPSLLKKIEALYIYLEIDGDEEHYNLGKEIPDNIRLFHLFEGRNINLINVRKSDGFNLNVEISL